MISERGASDARLRQLAVGVPPRCIELAQRGRLVLGEREPTGDWALHQPPIKTIGGVSIVAALLAERNEGP